MNREYKFRVWDNIDYMSKPFTFENLHRRHVEFTSDCPVMQFTGLKDKNGKEIYEGDIVEAKDGNKYEIGVIEYRLERFKIIWPVSCSHTPSISNNSTIIQIIGNVFEHPHLLNSEQNPEVCDATDDASKENAGNQIEFPNIPLRIVEGL